MILEDVNNRIIMCVCVFMFSGRTYIVKIAGSSAFTSVFSSEDCTPSDTFLPSGVILVQPATAERTLMEDQESAVR